MSVAYCSTLAVTANNRSRISGKWLFLHSIYIISFRRQSLFRRYLLTIWKSALREMKKAPKTTCNRYVSNCLVLFVSRFGVCMSDGLVVDDYWDAIVLRKLEFRIWIVVRQVLVMTPKPILFLCCWAYVECFVKFIRCDGPPRIGVRMNLDHSFAKVSPSRDRTLLQT